MMKPNQEAVVFLKLDDECLPDIRSHAGRPFVYDAERSTQAFAEYRPVAKQYGREGNKRRGPRERRGTRPPKCLSSPALHTRGEQGQGVTKEVRDKRKKYTGPPENVVYMTPKG